MTISQLGSLRSLSMTPRETDPKEPGEYPEEDDASRKFRLDI